MQHRKFEGLVAAPFTPFDKNNEINFSLIPQYYDFLQRNGVSGAFINGSTGEGPSLTQKEKQEQARAWAECVKTGGSLRVINMVGGTSLKECIENARLSEELGLSAVALVAPYYFKPAGAGMLAEFICEVGMSVPGMPVYFYHIPSLTGVNIQMSELMRIVAPMLPNFAGIKFTHEDLMDFNICLNYEGGRYDLLWGRDECMLSALAIGCKGFIGSTYNYAAPLYLKLIEEFNSGNMKEARALQLKSIKMISVLIRYGGMAPGKSYMNYIGINCGSFRSPVRNLTEAESADFERDVRELKIDGYLSRK